MVLKLDSTIELLNELLTNYSGSYGRLMFVAFVAALAFIIYLRKQPLRVLFVVPSILLAIVAFNPISIGLAERLRLISSSRFYRVLWVLPIAFVFGYVLTYLVTKINSKKMTLVLVGIISMSLLSIGNVYFLKDNYHLADNIYKIPDYIIEVSDAIHKDYNGESPLVLYDWNFLNYYRTYDPAVYSYSSRWTGPTVLEQVIDSNNKNTILAPSKFSQLAKDIDYVVCKYSEDNNSYFFEAEFHAIGTFGEYEVYRNNH